MDTEAIAQMQALLQASQDTTLKQSEEMMQRVTKENNALILEQMDKASTEKVEKGMEALRQELAPQLANLAEQLAKLAATQATMPKVDPWQEGRDRQAAASNGMAVDSAGSTDPQGSAGARGNSLKRRVVITNSSSKEGPTQVDPRNMRNPLRLHLKGFDRKVPPSVHRGIWEKILEDSGDFMEGSRLRVGRYDYKFEVDFVSEQQALQAMEIINNSAPTWTDPKGGKVSSIRAQTDKSPNAKRGNKIYGELRKLVEAWIVAQGLQPEDFQVRTSGPKGPLHVEGGAASDFEITKFHYNESTEVYTWQNDEASYEPLKLNANILEDLQKKALAAATKWD